MNVIWRRQLLFTLMQLKYLGPHKHHSKSELSNMRHMPSQTEEEDLWALLRANHQNIMPVLLGKRS